MELKNIQIVHNVIKYTSNTTTWTRIYPRSIAVKKGHVCGVPTRGNTVKIVNFFFFFYDGRKKTTRTDVTEFHATTKTRIAQKTVNTTVSRTQEVFKAVKKKIDKLRSRSKTSLLVEE